MNDSDLDAFLAGCAPPELAPDADRRLVAGLDALVAAPPATAEAEAVVWSWRDLPWAWLLAGAVALALTFAVELGAPRPGPAPREVWRYLPNPRPEVDPPQERFLGDPTQLFN
ncbi:MAG: hypothetical protein R3F62_22160 [Planctomycetota bacterium]